MTKVVYYNRFVLVQSRMGIQYCNMIEIWISFNFHTTWILFYVISHLQVSRLFVPICSLIFTVILKYMPADWEMWTTRHLIISLYTIGMIFLKWLCAFYKKIRFCNDFWSTLSFTATNKALYNLYKDCDINFTSLYMF